MDAQKYVIRKVIGLPGASIRILLEKGKNRTFLVPFLITLAVIAVGLLYIWLGLSGESRDKAIGAIINGLMWGGVYALITLGMVVVYKSSRIFNLGHGGVLLFLTYLAWWVYAPDRLNFPLWATLLVVLAAAIAIGLALDRMIFRGMIGQGGLLTFLVTMVLGFSLIHGITVLVFEGKSQIMPQIFPTGTIQVGNYHLSYLLLSSFIVATLMFVIFVSYFRYTKGGLAMRCVSEDNIISQSLGIDVKRIYALAWVVGCISAAIGGILLGSLTAVYSENGGIGGYAIMRALPIILLGGLESIPGAYLGAIIIGLAESLAGAYIDPHVPQFRAVLPYILMISIMIIRPQGLFGLKGIKRI